MPNGSRLALVSRWDFVRSIAALVTGLRYANPTYGYDEHPTFDE